MTNSPTTLSPRLDPKGWEEAGHTFHMNPEWWEPVLDHIDPPAHIVELGAGVGNYAYNLVKEGFSYTLVDFSDVILDYARERLGDRANYVVQDVLDGAYPKGDVCMSSGLLEHFTDEEIVTILTKSKMAAPLVISFVPNGMCPGYHLWRHEKEGKGEWEYGVERAMTSMAPFFHQAGLNVVAEYSVGTDFDRLQASDQKYLLVTVGTR